MALKARFKGTHKFYHLAVNKINGKEETSEYLSICLHCAGDKAQLLLPDDEI